MPCLCVAVLVSSSLLLLVVVVWLVLVLLLLLLLVMVLLFVVVVAVVVAAFLSSRTPLASFQVILFLSLSLYPSFFWIILLLMFPFYLCLSSPSLAS